MKKSKSKATKKTKAKVKRKLKIKAAMPKTKSMVKASPKTAGKRKSQTMSTLTSKKVVASKIKPQKIVEPDQRDVDEIRRRYREGIPTRRIIATRWGIAKAEQLTKQMIDGRHSIPEGEWDEALLHLLYDLVDVTHDDEDDDEDSKYGSGNFHYEAFEDWFYRQKLSKPQPL